MQTLKKVAGVILGPFWQAILMIFQVPGIPLRNLYLLRMPLLMLLAMCLFPVMSFGTPFFRSLTIGAYEMENSWAGVVAAALAGAGFCSAALSVQMTSGIIRGYGLGSPQNVNVAGYPTSWGPRWLWWSCAALVVILNVVWLSLVSGSWKVIGGVVAGVALYAIAYFAIRSHTSGGRGPLPATRLWIGYTLVRGWLKLTGWGKFIGTNRKLSALEDEITSAFVTLLMLLWVGWISVSRHLPENYVPPIFSVFALLGLATYLLTSLSFWLDQFRVPVITVISAYCSFMSLWKASDHYYRIWPGAPYQLSEADAAGAVALGGVDQPTHAGTPPREVPGTLANADQALPSATDNVIEARPPAAPVAIPAQDLAQMKSTHENPNSLGGPAKVLSDAAKGGRPVIVVVMAGGGIQAAAWPVEVLNQLGANGKVDPNGKNLHRHVCMISGVSGGSVGAMYYAQAFTPTATPGAKTNSNTIAIAKANDAGQATSAPIPGADPASANELQQFRERVNAASWAASASSLAGATRGMLRYDLLKVLASPFAEGNIYGDRGLGLECSLRDNAKKTQVLAGLETATLSAWRDDALQGNRPALIFNSTIVETGERLAFSTVPCAHAGDGAEEFTRRYPGMDIAMTTAARMSATFPFVSPAARPGPASGFDGDGSTVPGPVYWKHFPRGGSLHHLADGGYVEASGLDGAVQWLDQGLTELANHPTAVRPKDILVVAMSGFPSALADPNGVVDAGERPVGAITDLLSPLRTLTSVYSLGRSLKGGSRVQMFKANWASRGEDSGYAVNIHIRTIYPLLEAGSEAAAAGWKVGADISRPPLSWHLRECEKEAIRKKVKELIEPVAAKIPTSGVPKDEFWKPGKGLTIETDPRCAIWDIAHFLAHGTMPPPPTTPEP